MRPTRLSFRHLIHAILVLLLCAAIAVPPLALARTIGRAQAGQLRFTYMPRSELKVVYMVSNLFDTIGYVENIYRLGNRPEPHPPIPERGEFETHDNFNMRHNAWKQIMRYVKFKFCNMVVTNRFMKIHRYDIQNNTYIITVTLDDDDHFIGAVTSKPFLIGTGPRSFNHNSEASLSADNVLRFRASVSVNDARTIRDNEEDAIILVRRVKPYINIDKEIRDKSVLALFLNENTSYELRLGEQSWPLVLTSTTRR
ncbi:MAG: hypothetical protein ACLFOY_04995 [Desulfatibacillaceae bacterium]